MKKSYDIKAKINITYKPVNGKTKCKRKKKKGLSNLRLQKLYGGGRIK